MRTYLCRLVNLKKAWRRGAGRWLTKRRGGLRRHWRRCWRQAVVSAAGSTKARPGCCCWRLRVRVRLRHGLFTAKVWLWKLALRLLRQARGDYPRRGLRFCTRMGGNWRRGGWWRLGDTWRAGIKRGGTTHAGMCVHGHVLLLATSQRLGRLARRDGLRHGRLDSRTWRCVGCCCLLLLLELTNIVQEVRQRWLRRLCELLSKVC